MGKIKRILRSRFFLIPANLLLILITAIAIFRLYNQNEIKKRLTAIRAAGYPLSYEELDQWYPDVPEDENAAIIILKAIDAMFTWEEKPIPFDQCEIYHLDPKDRMVVTIPGLTIDKLLDMESIPLTEIQRQDQPPADWNIKNNKLLPFIGDSELPDFPDLLSTESLAVIEDYLADNAKSLQLLHQATALSRARYPLDFSQGFPMSPHLADIRIVAKMLCLEAIVYIERNQSEQALQSIISVISTANSLKNEPILVSAFVKMSCESLAYTTVEYILNHTTLSTQQIQTLLTASTNVNNRTVLARAIAGQLSFNHDFYTNSEYAVAMNLFGLIELQYRTYLDFRLFKKICG